MSLKTKPLYKGALALVAAAALSVGGFTATAAFADEAPSPAAPSSEEAVAPEAQEATPDTTEVAPPEESTNAEETDVDQPEATEPAPESQEPTEDTASTEPAVEPETPTETTPSEEPVVADEAGKTPAPTCVTSVKNDRNHTFNNATGAVTLTVGGGEVGQPLCNPGSVGIALFGFVEQNKQWKQQLVDIVYIDVDKVGTYSATPKFAAKCRQYDAYAADGGRAKVTPPDVLYGPANPYEPSFLHDYSNGPTSHDIASAEGCAGMPETPGPRVETRQQGGFVCGDAVVTINNIYRTIPSIVVFNENGEWVAVDDVDHITETSDTTEYPLTAEEIESCKPATPEDKETSTEWEKKHPVCDATTVEETRSVTTTKYTPVLVSGSTWNLQETTTTALETRTVPVEKVEACPTTVVPPASTPDKPAPKPTPPPGLADTGVFTAPAGYTAAGLLFAGMAFLGIMAIRRRKAAATATNE